MAPLRLFLTITLFLSGVPWSIWFFYRYALYWRYSDPKYQIVGIVQRYGSQDQLKTAHLAEMLNLSVDRPSNLYTFDLRRAEQNLLEKNIFKSLKIKRVKPGTLFIDYTLRTPIAYLGDFSNLALDAEGRVFPFTPFYTPKKLPEIYVGPASPFSEKKKQTALEILNRLSCKSVWEGLVLQKIDVSKMDANSYGQREIVLVLEEKLERPRSRILRLNSEDYLLNLNEYYELRKILNLKDSSVQSTVVDLRIPQLAFITQE